MNETTNRTTENCNQIKQVYCNAKIMNYQTNKSNNCLNMTSGTTMANVSTIVIVRKTIKQYQNSINKQDMIKNIKK